MAIKFRKITSGFLNLKRWFRIIWNDGNYDYEFILIILHHKLKLMREEFDRVDRWCFEGEEVVKKQLQDAITILEELCDDSRGEGDEVKLNELFRIIGSNIIHWWR